MRIYRYGAPGVLAACTIWGCASTPAPPPTVPPPSGAPLATFFALGDWGTGNADQRAVGIALGEEVRALEAAGVLPIPPFVLGLGDNLYPKGFHDSRAFGAPDVRAAFDRTFTRNYADVRYGGSRLDFHVVSGNHDWGKRVSSEDEWGDVAQNEAWAEGVDDSYHYYPFPHDRLGIPDTNDEAELAALHALDLPAAVLPERVEIGEPRERLALFAFDSQAILALLEGGREDAAERHFQALDSLLAASDTDWKIVFAHHPLVTHGFHSGYAGLEQWLWSGPRNGFTKYVPWYLRIFTAPLAPFGVAGDRWLTKSVQDLDNRHNETYQRRVSAILLERGVRVMLSGHDHNLQLLRVGDADAGGGLLQVVSGSAGQADPVGSGEDTYFFRRALGYARFDVRAESLQITFVGVDPDDPAPETLAAFTVSRDGRVSAITAPPRRTSPS